MMSSKTIWVSMSMCFNQKPPKHRYDYKAATILSSYLWLRLTPVRVLVTVAYEPWQTNIEELNHFEQQLLYWGAETKLVPIDQSSTCDCITQALWQRILSWSNPEMDEDDLMMISESDVLITTSSVLQPLEANFRAWLYWAETALYGGQTFAMSFTTLHKKDWRLILEGSETCEAALEKFPQFAKVETIGNWTKEMYGSNWESDQNIVTAQLIRHKICTLPPGHNIFRLFFPGENTSLFTGSDAKTCYKGSGWGECRSYNFGNTWYEEIGGCPWFHHWYPLQLLKNILDETGEHEFMNVFEDHLIQDENIERLFFDHRKPY